MAKEKKHCSNCHTKYTVDWNEEEQDLKPWTCPFCGYEVEEEDFDDTSYEEAGDDSWS